MKRLRRATKKLSRRLSAFVVLLVAITMHAGSGKAAGVDERPNILFFLSDDQRYDAMGIAGHPILQTPTIDRLATQGVRFGNMFVTSPICAASRASILTGLHERTHRFTFATPPLALLHADTSYPVLLRKSGYQTGFVGKFGVEIEGGRGEEIFDYFKPVDRSPYYKKQADGTLRHADEISGDYAVAFLRSARRTEPFCLSVSFNAAHAEDRDLIEHYPWPKAMDGLYQDAIIPPPRLSDPKIFVDQPLFLQKSLNRQRWFWRWDTAEKYQRNARAYYRMISGLDQIIGRVLSELQTLGMAKNTIVVFSSDNGYYMGDRGFAGKWSHYEESLRVPLIISDPRVSRLRRSRVVYNMALNIDIPATILDYAHVPVPDHYQGRSLVPLVQAQQPVNWRTEFFCEHLMDHKDIPKWEGIRQERFVYARYFEQVPVFEFLYDLKIDPDQLRNLAGDPAYSQSLQGLRLRSTEFRDRYGGAIEVQ